MVEKEVIEKIINKCDIYYGNALISKETILKRYFEFFSDSFISKERTVSFAIHTGSVCFDVVSVVAATLGCLLYNLSTNDDIISSLQVDDMIIYNGQRYRWKGTQISEGVTYILIEQYGKGKNGKATSYIPLEHNKHLIRPYYGKARVTGGRGIGRTKTNRENFLLFLFDTDIENIPTQLNVSVVIVANRNIFSEICKKLRILYDGTNEINLLEIVPAAYYTRSREMYQFGQNPTKVEAVLKVTDKISIARDLVLDKRNNKVVGLLINDGASIMRNGTELDDLIRRKTMNFIHIALPLSAGIDERVLDRYENASMFVCTKEYLSNGDWRVRRKNQYTVELYKQIMNVIHNTVEVIHLDDGWIWDEYKNIKSIIYAVGQSNEEDSLKKNFVLVAYNLLNLIDTAVFPLEIMEMAIQTEKFNRNVISPCKRIAELWGIVDRMQIMQTQCMYVADALERKYKERLKICHKADALKNYIKTHRSYEIAIVVPKAYYKELLRMVFAEYFCDAKIVCVTANRFDINQKYDYILCVGNINNKRFDPLQCFSARNIDVLLYSYEEIVFNYRRQRITAYKNMLNQKSGTKFKKVETCDSYSSEKQMDVIVRQFCDLDEYIENFNFFDITRFAQKNTTERNTVPVSEVKYIGSFISGERIFFSKYYSAVVFDNVTGSVVEKSPELLQAGDVLVFTKRDNYTKNIVDIVYERLLNEGRLGLGAIESYEKSQYWKEVLREYKKNNNFTYRNVSQRMHDVGSSVQEVTVRQWLVEESHIVGPREGVTMQHIANITNDPYLLADPQAFFEACIAVRRDRRKILNLISIAINEKLKGNYPGDESIMSVVYDNIDNLSKTIELEHVSELDSSININSSFVNIPLTGGEVLL